MSKRGRRSERRRREKTSTTVVSPKTALRDRERSRRLYRFIGVFIGLLVTLKLVYYLGLHDSAFMNGYLSMDTAISGLFLPWFGYDVVARSNQLVGDSAHLEVRTGCDAIQPFFIYLAAVMAFPSVPRKTRLLGLLGGFLCLNVLNIVRIVSLYAIRADWPEYFRTAHTFVWQALFIVAVFLLWMAWCLRMAIPNAKGSS